MTRYTRKKLFLLSAAHIVILIAAISANGMEHEPGETLLPPPAATVPIPAAPHTGHESAQDFTPALTALDNHMSDAAHRASTTNNDEKRLTLDDLGAIFPFDE